MLITPSKVESLGNKSVLEKRINIRASDYKFCDKVKYYEGCENGHGAIKEGTIVKELLDMFNKGLANIKANGKYQAILDKYLK